MNCVVSLVLVATCCGAELGPNEAGAEKSVENVRQRLRAPFHERLLLNTYDHIRARAAADGYFPESVTGAYPGMFSRTSGAFARMFIETGEYDLVERNLDYVLQAMTQNDFERAPHVMGPRKAGAPESVIPIISGEDEVDGQAHVILGWALLAAARGSNPFEDRTYAFIARLLDRTTDAPYVMGNTGMRIGTGLVLNHCLEHSRDGQYWLAYDFLTQSFVAAALEHAIPVAARRGDSRHVQLWTDRLARLKENIAKRMTRDFDGKKIYLEMLLPTGRAPQPFPGLGWLNLAPIPAAWDSVDPVLFKDTIDTWHRVAQIDWDGPRVCASDWLPEGEKDASGNRIVPSVIGKVAGWDAVYCWRTKQYGRLCDLLDFLEKVNTTPDMGECFWYNRETRKWSASDPGNGEQACWYCWAMLDLRKAAGLPALPDRSVLKAAGAS
ncbi:MAG: hypothetical protein HZB26_22010 [Candidatus Hydrogenedentes bacterium]|nr:hypothetical protein [Candidatus Hydrogenedentota bacterium]